MERQSDQAQNSGDRRLLRRSVALFAVLSLAAASFTAVEARFFDGLSTGMTITVGPFVDSVPTECASMNFKHVVTGTEDDDELIAGNGKSLVLGLSGNDTLSAGNAPDCLSGGPGDDILYGDNGPDVLDGGDGYDICIGGRGPMTFVNCEAFELPAVGSPSPDGGAPTATPTAAATADPTPTASPDPTAAPTTEPTVAP